MKSSLLFLVALSIALVSGTARAHTNVIIFVADGLRAGSVNPIDAPELDQLQREGVRFTNSHSLFPTVTTANASAIATGHGLGDTGDFANSLFFGYAVPAKNLSDSLTPYRFLEDDTTLRNLDQNPKFNGDYLGEKSLLAWARQRGYQTASIGKQGPTLIQDVTRNNPDRDASAPGDTVVIDDKTGASDGVRLSDGVTDWFKRADMTPTGPGISGMQPASAVQLQFFADALTKVVLPMFASNRQPFVIIFWSREPDATQHAQRDSLDSLTPGINGPSSKAAIKNCSAMLGQIREALRTSGLASNTDIFVTADHGFDTVSHREVRIDGGRLFATTNDLLKYKYVGAQGRVEAAGSLPPGFLAIDLATHLALPLYDPDAKDTTNTNSYKLLFHRLPPAGEPVPRPAGGSGLIGGTGRMPANPTDVGDATVAVMPNGGAGLIYLPQDHSATDVALVRDIVGFLTTRDYISGIFVNDDYWRNGNTVFPGALRFSDVGLYGSAKLPRPAIIVNFASFTTDDSDPVRHGVIVADTTLREGQGNHGGFDRGATWNFMAAVGPDFKAGYTDPAPVSNADIAATFEELLKLDATSNGKLGGRVVTEALAGRPDVTSGSIHSGRDESQPLNETKTILDWQEYDGHRYFDAAGFPGRTLGLRQ